MELAATFAKILRLKSHTSALPRSNLKPGWSQCNRELCGRHKMKLTHTLVSDPKNPTEVGLSFQQAVGFFARASPGDPCGPERRFSRTRFSVPVRMFELLALQT